MTEHPAEALDRLKAFLGQYPNDTVVNRLSGLTTINLEEIIARIEAMSDMVSVPYLDLGKPYPPA